MAKKRRHSSAEIARKLAHANELATRGKLQSDIARTLRVSVMTFLSEAAFAWRVRSRATCRLSTFFTPLIESFRSGISPYYPHRPATAGSIGTNTESLKT